MFSSGIIFEIIFLSLLIETTTGKAVTAASSGTSQGCDKECQTECINVLNEYRTNHDAPKLQFSQELADKAQKWADGGKFGYDMDTRGKYGQLIEWDVKDELPSFTSVIKHWHDKEKDFDFVKGTSKNGETLHDFTQVVWKKAHKAGCGRGKMLGSRYYVVWMDADGVISPITGGSENVGPPKRADIHWFEITKIKAVGEPLYQNATNSTNTTGYMIGGPKVRRKTSVLPSDEEDVNFLENEENVLNDASNIKQYVHDSLSSVLAQENMEVSKLRDEFERLDAVPNVRLGSSSQNTYDGTTAMDSVYDDNKESGTTQDKPEAESIKSNERIIKLPNQGTSLQKENVKVQNNLNKKLDSPPQQQANVEKLPSTIEAGKTKLTESSPTTVIHEELNISDKNAASKAAPSSKSQEMKSNLTTGKRYGSAPETSQDNARQMAGVIMGKLPENGTGEDGNQAFSKNKNLKITSDEDLSPDMKNELSKVAKFINTRLKALHRNKASQRTQDSGFKNEYGVKEKAKAIDPMTVKMEDEPGARPATITMVGTPLSFPENKSEDIVKDIHEKVTALWDEHVKGKKEKEMKEKVHSHGENDSLYALNDQEGNDEPPVNEGSASSEGDVVHDVGELHGYQYGDDYHHHKEIWPDNYDQNPSNDIQVNKTAQTTTNHGNHLNNYLPPVRLHPGGDWFGGSYVPPASPLYDDPITHAMNSGPGGLYDYRKKYTGEEADKESGRFLERKKDSLQSLVDVFEDKDGSADSAYFKDGKEPALQPIITPRKKPSVDSSKSNLKKEETKPQDHHDLLALPKTLTTHPDNEMTLAEELPDMIHDSPFDSVTNPEEDDHPGYFNEEPGLNRPTFVNENSNQYQRYPPANTGHPYYQTRPSYPLQQNSPLVQTQSSYPSYGQQYPYGQMPGDGLPQSPNQVYGYGQQQDPIQTVQEQPYGQEFGYPQQSQVQGSMPQGNIVFSGKPEQHFDNTPIPVQQQKILNGVKLPSSMGVLTDNQVQQSALTLSDKNGNKSPDKKPSSEGSQETNNIPLTPSLPEEPTDEDKDKGGGTDSKEPPQNNTDGIMNLPQNQSPQGQVSGGTPQDGSSSVIQTQPQQMSMPQDGSSNGASITVDGRPVKGPYQSSGEYTVKGPFVYQTDTTILMGGPQDSGSDMTSGGSSPQLPISNPQNGPPSVDSSTVEEPIQDNEKSENEGTHFQPELLKRPSLITLLKEAEMMNKTSKQKPSNPEENKEKSEENKNGEKPEGLNSSGERPEGSTNSEKLPSGSEENGKPSGDLSKNEKEKGPKEKEGQEEGPKEKEAQQEEGPKEKEAQQEEGPKEKEAQQEEGPKEKEAQQEGGPKEKEAQQEGPKEKEAQQEEGPKEKEAQQEGPKEKGQEGPKEKEGQKEGPKDKEAQQERPKEKEGQDEGTKDKEAQQEGPKAKEGQKEGPKEKEGQEEGPKEKEAQQEEGPKEKEAQQEGPKDKEGQEGPKEKEGQEGPKAKEGQEEGPKEKEAQQEEGPKEKESQQEGPKEKEGQEGPKDKEGQEEGPKEKEGQQEGPKEKEPQQEEGPKEKEGQKEGQKEGPKDKEAQQERPKEKEGQDEGTKEKEGQDEGPKDKEAQQEGPKAKEGQKEGPKEKEGQEEGPKEKEGQQEGPKDKEGQKEGSKEKEGQQEGPKEKEGQKEGPKEKEGQEGPKEKGQEGPKEKEGQEEGPKEKEGQKEETKDKEGQEEGPTEKEGQEEEPKEKEGQKEGPKEETPQESSQSEEQPAESSQEQPSGSSNEKEQKESSEGKEQSGIKFRNKSKSDGIKENENKPGDEKQPSGTKDNKNEPSGSIDPGGSSDNEKESSSSENEENKPYGSTDSSESSEKQTYNSIDLNVPENKNQPKTSPGNEIQPGLHVSMGPIEGPENEYQPNNYEGNKGPLQKENQNQYKVLLTEPGSFQDEIRANKVGKEGVSVYEKPSFGLSEGATHHKEAVDSQNPLHSGTIMSEEGRPMQDQLHSASNQSRENHSKQIKAKLLLPFTKLISKINHALGLDSPNSTLKINHISLSSKRPSETTSQGANALGPVVDKNHESHESALQGSTEKQATHQPISVGIPEMTPSHQIEHLSEPNGLVPDNHHVQLYNIKVDRPESPTTQHVVMGTSTIGSRRPSAEAQSESAATSGIHHQNEGRPSFTSISQNGLIKIANRPQQAQDLRPLHSEAQSQSNRTPLVTQHNTGEHTSESSQQEHPELIITLQKQREKQNLTPSGSETNMAAEPQSTGIPHVQEIHDTPIVEHAHPGSSITQSCKDNGERCSLWQSKGYCNNVLYTGFMKQHCKSTCGYCALPSVVLQSERANDGIKYAYNEVCRDSPTYEFSCPEWKAQGYCQKKEKEMRRFCGSTCNFCKRTKVTKKKKKTKDDHPEKTTGTKTEPCQPGNACGQPQNYAHAQTGQGKEAANAQAGNAGGQQPSYAHAQVGDNSNAQSTAYAQGGNTYVQTQSSSTQQTGYAVASAAASPEQQTYAQAQSNSPSGQPSTAYAQNSPSSDSQSSQSTAHAQTGSKNVAHAQTTPVNDDPKQPKKTKKGEGKVAGSTNSRFREMTLEEQVMSESPEYKATNFDYHIRTADPDDPSETLYDESPPIRFSNKNIDSITSNENPEGNFESGLERNSESEQGSSNMGRFLDEAESKAGFSKDDIKDMEVKDAEDERLQGLMNRFDPDVAERDDAVAYDKSIVSAQIPDKKGTLDFVSTHGCDKSCQRECLDAINSYRRNHGVRPLILDQDLATHAQQWADSKTYGHSPWAQRGMGGELIAVGSFYKTFTAAVKAWHDEEKNIDWDTGTLKMGKEIKHFKQLISKDAHVLGCGMSLVNGEPYYIAQMDATGNNDEEKRETLEKPDKPDLGWYMESSPYWKDLQERGTIPNKVHRNLL